MWFASSEWVKGSMDVSIARTDGSVQIDIRYGGLRILLTPDAALATLDNLRAALEAAGCTPVTIEVEDSSEEGLPR